MEGLARPALAAFHFGLPAFESKLDSADNRRMVHNTAHKTDR